MLELSYCEQGSCAVCFQLGLFLGDFAVWNGTKCRAELPSHAPKLQKAGVCPMEDMPSVAKLPSGVSHGGCELNGNESSAHIIK